jgi:16S rRNA A1518/A1519 N6-dimethyltransferase RsmA/KsgA/DIM1 with predicted DNA glycosylase/AP lyase activity
VDSALVAFRRRAELPFEWSALKRVVEGSFAHRRKHLPNSLELAGITSRDQAAAALAQIGHGSTVRAEELEPADFAALAEALR